jgi:hypothetical protein
MALVSLDDSERIGDWISVYTGRQYYPIDPRASEVDILDIAHSLSLLCRYNGHCDRFYSVAEHCIHVSYAVPEEYALEGLLHDAAEAYTSDVPRPLKYCDDLTLFREVEDKNNRVIAEKFNLPYPESSVVKHFDSRMLCNEGYALLSNTDWYKCLEPIPDIEIIGWLPLEAERRYLERYAELIDK